MMCFNFKWLWGCCLLLACQTAKPGPEQVFQQYVEDAFACDLDSLGQGNFILLPTTICQGCGEQVLPHFPQIAQQPDCVVIASGHFARMHAASFLQHQIPPTNIWVDYNNELDRLAYLGQNLALVQVRGGQVTHFTAQPDSVMRWVKRQNWGSS